ncbi:MAG: hypothetical protein FJ395_02105 [Verrucomicrobia bacterium]|nr:hypothetical protein [Verrucomicrobiota bacterium]
MADDRQMTIQVRKLITSNWIDVSQIRIRVIRGVITLQGHVEKIGGAPGEKQGTEAGMRKLDDELRSLKGFRGLAYFLDNWIRDPTGAWRCTTKKDAKQ